MLGDDAPAPGVHCLPFVSVFEQAGKPGGQGLEGDDGLQLGDGGGAEHVAGGVRTG